MSPEEKTVDDARLKQLAFQVVLILPSNFDEAARVLKYARDLLEWQIEPVAAPLFRLIS